MSPCPPNRFHTHRVERLETDVEDLKTRVERLEQRPDPSARAGS